MGKEIKDFIEILKELSVYFDYRKMVFSKICLSVARFSQKLVKFYNIEDWRDLFWLNLEEYVELISSGEFDKALVEQRKKFVVTVFSQEGTKTFQGKEAEELAELVFLSTEKTTDEIRGQVASKADKKIVEGRARVLLSPSEVNQMKQGEVLISVMTNPSYMAAIRKASAIVTDEGGITSHAAIVARELGIPAIIGTKNATRLIKTGDGVKLNFETGEIRILKRR
jgi:phosphoenolpyruvate synthase/pyruvate phosphate dikinase